jgi:hypothetical protein
LLPPVWPIHRPPSLPSHSRFAAFPLPIHPLPLLPPWPFPFSFFFTGPLALSVWPSPTFPPQAPPFPAPNPPFAIASPPLSPLSSPSFLLPLNQFDSSFLTHPLCCQPVLFLSYNPGLAPCPFPFLCQIGHFSFSHFFACSSSNNISFPFHFFLTLFSPKLISRQNPNFSVLQIQYLWPFFWP